MQKMQLLAFFNAASPKNGNALALLLYHKILASLQFKTMGQIKTTIKII